MSKIEITIDTDKSYRENLSEMIKLAEFLTDHEDYAKLMQITIENVAKRKIEEMLKAS